MFTDGTCLEALAGGIERGSPEAGLDAAPELRRRPWEPAQSRWAQAGCRRTTWESPEPAPKNYLIPCIHLETIGPSRNKTMPQPIATKPSSWNTLSPMESDCSRRLETMIPVGLA